MLKLLEDDSNLYGIQVKACFACVKVCVFMFATLTGPNPTEYLYILTSC